MKDNRKTSLTDHDTRVINMEIYSLCEQYRSKWLEVLKSRPEVRAALSRVEGELAALAQGYVDLVQKVGYVGEYHKWLYHHGTGPLPTTNTTVYIYKYQFEVQVPDCGIWQLRDTRFLSTEDCQHLPELRESIEEHQKVLEHADKEIKLVRCTVDNVLNATGSIRIINNVLPQLATASPHFARLVAEAPPVKRQRKLKDEEVVKSLDTPEFRAALGKMLISKE